MIDIYFKHLPEDVWFTHIDPDGLNDTTNLYRLFENIDQVRSISVSNLSRHLIEEAFRNIPMPTVMPKTLVFVGDFARQILGQLITMALNEEPFLMGYFPIRK